MKRLRQRFIVLTFRIIICLGTVRRRFRKSIAMDGKENFRSPRRFANLDARLQLLRVRGGRAVNVLIIIPRHDDARAGICQKLLHSFRDEKRNIFFL